MAEKPNSPNEVDTRHSGDNDMNEHIDKRELKQFRAWKKSQSKQASASTGFKVPNRKEVRT